MRFGRLIRWDNALSVLAYWSEPDSVRFGKKAAVATPIWALAAATLRSASATSGRLSNRVEGTPAGTVGTSARIAAGLKEKSAGCAPDQHGNRVLEQRPLDFRVDLGGLTGEQLRLGADDIGLGGDAEAIAALSDLQGELLRDHRVVQQPFQLVLGTQLEIIGRKSALCG